MRYRSSSLGALVVAGILCASRGVRAGDATEPIRIEYRAEPGCPSADEFNAQVLRRTASARIANASENARTFIVGIGRRGTSLVGSLVVRQTDGTTASREVAGPDCGEVATVLALATALAIDPQASLSAEPAATPPATPEPEPKSPPKSPPPSEPPPVTLTSDEQVAAWSLLLGPKLESGIAPRLAYGGSLGFGWRTPDGKAALSAASIEVTLLGTPAYSVNGAKSSFRFAYAEPSICSIALKWAQTSGIAPCFGGEIGAVTGWGSNIPHASQRTRVWASLDLGLALHQALGTSWFVEGGVGFVLPVTRYHYVFRDPSTPIFAVPNVAAYGNVRVGARLF